MIIKRLFIFLILLAVLGSFASFADDFQDTLGREFVLYSTHDPDNFVRFTAQGTAIHAEGRFTDRVVTDFFINAGILQNAERSFSRSADGSFKAAFTSTPTASNGTAVIQFDDGLTMSFRVEFRAGVGWFFGDNGLGARTDATLENYYTASREVSARYVSAALDLAEAKDTLDRLLEIVDEVTAGITDDYQKAKALNRWVAENIAYDRDARDNEVTEETITIATTLRLNRSICIGIANTYGALLEAAGLKVLNIKGGIVNVSEGVPYELLSKKTLVHEWVAFWYEAENRWVYTDPTWDRRSFFERGRLTYRPSLIKHFDMSPLALSLDHRGDRAELREYFRAPDFIMEMEDTPPPEPDNPDNPDDPDNPVPPPPEPGSPDVPPPPPFPVPLEDDGFLLYLTIAVMAALAVILTYIVIKKRR
jgi:hypothetical protein